MALLPLYKGVKGKRSIIKYALVPDECLDAICKFHKQGWSLKTRKKGSSVDYSYCTKLIGGKSISFSLHRIVYEMLNGPIPEGMVIDHVDHDGLNCMESNLRIATQSQNMQNQRMHRRISGRKSQEQRYKGARKRHVSERSNPWESRINLGKGVVTIGHFSSEVEAAFAYNVAAEHAFKDFACLNVLPLGELSDARKSSIASQVFRKLTAVQNSYS